ncbi:MAG: PEP-utilizing enzyme [bacterium]
MQIEQAETVADNSPTLWTRALSEEFWGGVVSPLMFSLAGGLIEERMVQKGVRLAGLKELRREKFLRLSCGRVYVNCRILEEICRLVPSALLVPELLRILPAEVRDRLAGVRVPLLSFRTLRMAARFFALDPDWAPFSNYRSFQRAVRRLEGGAAGPVGPSSNTREDLPDLLARIRRTCSELGSFLDIVIWGMIFAYVLHPLTAILARRWAGDAREQLAASLTVGLDGIRTFEINREIESLAEAVDADSFLEELFRCADAEEILRSLAAAPGAAAFRQRFQTFLGRHGHRFRARDLSHPTWRERPQMVVELIQKNRRADRSRRSLPVQKEKREHAEAELKRRMRGSRFGVLKRALFSLCLFYDRKYFALRENMRYYADMHLERCRRYYLEIGSRWKAAGLLGAEEDIFYLTREEVEGSPTGEGVREAAEKRKADYGTYHRIRAPKIIREGAVAPELPPIPEDEQLELFGEVASPGTAHARARVIRRPQDLLEFQRGEILVAEYTDPSWTPVLPMAAGLVLCLGGLLSHGSIIAREYGIPALIHVAGALQRIRTGDSLWMNADQGKVRIER